MTDSVFVLVHSPLVGPLTWQPVAERLREIGFRAIAPALPLASTTQPPYWKAQAEAVADGIAALPPDARVILVGHSGSGMLLPVIGRLSSRPVAAYIFIDSGIPEHGRSRLDGFAPEEAKAFRQAAVEGMIQPWTEEDLKEVIPDPDMRRRFVSELNPVPLAMYEEPVPVFGSWPDTPCGYIAFRNEYFYAYEASEEHAKSCGWVYTVLAGAHFHMLADPAAVSNALVHAFR